MSRSDSSPLTIRPGDEGRTIWLTTRADSPETWRLRIPERIFSDQGVVVGHHLERPIDWTEYDDGPGFRYRRTNQYDVENSPPGSIAYTVAVVPVADGVAVRLGLRNTGETRLTNVVVNPCLSHRSEPFRGQLQERTYIRRDDRMVSLDETDRGEAPLRAHYPVEGGTRVFWRSKERPDHDPGNERHSYFWGTLSDTRATDGRIVTVPHGNSRVISLWFEPGGELLQNSDDDNQCIHSDPGIPVLEPGETDTVVGRIYYIALSPDEFLAAHPDLPAFPTERE